MSREQEIVLLKNQVENKENMIVSLHFQIEQQSEALNVMTEDYANSREEVTLLKSNLESSLNTINVYIILAGKRLIFPGNGRNV